jgi:hypothetical protein
MRDPDPAEPDSFSYRVTVFYREPTYQQRTCRVREPYRYTFDVEAADPESAREHALAAFRDMAIQSGAGWIREIVDIVVRTAER